MLEVLRWPALGYAVASRLGYVCYVGVALRREEQRRLLTRQEGPEGGFQRFRRVTSRIMTNDGVAFVAACVAGWGTLPDLGISRVVVAAAGAGLVILGVGTKLWARVTLGAEAYYWVDFFTDAPEVVPARAGPYRFLKNPMYTVGYAHTYGLALVTASVPGLLAALFDQAAILVFHRLVERPHFERNRAVTAGPTLSDDHHL